jgi:predicted lipid-binding transport protein (Tim44 family)
METIWERRVERDKHRRNLRLFWMLYGIPAGIIIVVGGLIEGLGGAAGLLILLGVIGSMIFFAIWLTGRNERTNPTITRDGDHLCWASRRVPISQVASFTTFQREASMTMVGITGSHTNAAADIGTARFELTDGNTVDFAFPHLDDHQLEELRAALDAVLPGKWRPLERS